MGDGGVKLGSKDVNTQEKPNLAKRNTIRKYIFFYTFQIKLFFGIKSLRDLTTNSPMKAIQ